MGKLRVLDLFSGIGGFSLGLERTGGFETVAFCEIEEYPRRVLAKHWPRVPIYHDVRELTADTLRGDGIAVDVICGGFPCQDISFAGAGAGIEGSRSGLWAEYARLIGELRPRFVIVENVAALLGRGLGRVLGDLATLGYDAQWDCIPASAVGAPHRRDRVWIVGYACGSDGERRTGSLPRAQAAFGGAGQFNGHLAHGPEHAGEGGRARHVPDADRQGQHDGAIDAEVGGPSEPMADATIDGRKPRRARDASEVSRGRQSDRSRVSEGIRNANVSGLAFPDRQSRDVGEEFTPSIGADWWLSEPDVGRVAHGVPARVDRLKALGNAVVPQIPELIGKAILEASRSRMIKEPAE